MRVLLAPAVTFNDRSTSTPYTESLQPPQIHSHYKCIILSLTKIPFIALLNLYQSTHSNLSPFSTSRCPSMMASIIEIVLYTKPTAERQYLLRASCHPLHNKRAFPALLQPCMPWEYDVYVSPTRTGRYNERVHTITLTHTSDSPTRIPLVVGYHPAIRSISSIFHKHIYILSSSQHGVTRC